MRLREFCSVNVDQAIVDGLYGGGNGKLHIGRSPDTF